MLPNVARRPLLALSRNTRIRALVEKFPATAGVVDRYVAGVTVADAVAQAAALAADGMSVTIDYLGEDVTTAEGADHTRDTYLDLISALQSAGLTNGGVAEVSVKPTALGAGAGVSGVEDRLADICAAAEAAGTTVTIDMEDHTTTDATLELVRSLRVKYPWLGAVLQAYLHRTLSDIEAFAEPGGRIRLCKGAYDEPASVAYTVPGDIDKNYVRCLALLMSRPGTPMIATHDPRLVAIAKTLAAHNHRPKDDYEIQMLHGVRPAEQRRLTQAGHRVRVYVPFGEDWYGYMIRRMAERPQNFALFLRSLVGRG